MNVRDRQLATAIIWIGLFFALGLMVPRIMDLQADLNGLWPGSGLGYNSSVVDVGTISSALGAARAQLPEVMAQAQASIAGQIAASYPLAVVVSLGLIVAAGAATWLIWRHAGLEAKLAVDLLTFEKAKRRNRIERFVDDLDVDELDDLRAQLGDEADDVGWQHSSGRGV
ncbi:MAG: hypothetical protein IH587_02640 [Anaerolineae bacterium]|nr:hypothetical protein [Anaerolineae bacterium]